MTITPNILEETSRGIQSYAIEDMMLKNREIFLTSAINDQSAVDTIKQLMYLDHKSADPVTIYINSPGGSVISGMAIYDYIRLMRSPVTTVCVGTAASMGAILFLSGSRRMMLPHSKVMIHDPYFGRHRHGRPEAPGTQGEAERPDGDPENAGRSHRGADRHVQAAGSEFYQKGYLL